MKSITQLPCATDVVAFLVEKQLEEHAMYPNAKQNVIRFFHLVMLDNVDHRFAWDCKSILEYRSIHSISFVSHINVTWLNLGQLACFCL
jgi:hypothetical protein